MVEAMAHVPFAMPQYYCIPNTFLERWGYMYPQIKKVVGMLSKINYFRLIGGSNPIPQRSITSDH
jgi:hypothetical protein